MDTAICAEALQVGDQPPLSAGLHLQYYVVLVAESPGLYYGFWDNIQTMVEFVSLNDMQKCKGFRTKAMAESHFDKKIKEELVSTVVVWTQPPLRPVTPNWSPIWDHVKKDGWVAKDKRTRGYQAALDLLRSAEADKQSMRPTPQQDALLQPTIDGARYVTTVSTRSDSAAGKMHCRNGTRDQGQARDTQAAANTDAGGTAGPDAAATLSVAARRAAKREREEPLVYDASVVTAAAARLAMIRRRLLRQTPHAECLELAKGCEALELTMLLSPERLLQGVQRRKARMLLEALEVSHGLQMEIANAASANLLQGAALDFFRETWPGIVIDYAEETAWK